MVYQQPERLVFLQDCQFVVDDLVSVMSADAVVSTHPVIVPLTSSYQIIEAFDVITYSKVHFHSCSPPPLYLYTVTVH